MNNRNDEFESLHEYKKKYEELKGALFGQDSDAMNHGQALDPARYLFDKLTQGSCLVMIQEIRLNVTQRGKLMKQFSDDFTLLISKAVAE